MKVISSKKEKLFRKIKNVKISRKIIRKFHEKNSEFKKKKNVSENYQKRLQLQHQLFSQK